MVKNKKLILQPKPDIFVYFLAGLIFMIFVDIALIANGTCFSKLFEISECLY